jgi:restriction endonuclease S subunit
MRASEQFRIYGNSPIKHIVDFFIHHTLKQISFEELGNYIEEIKTGKTPAKKENKYWNKEEYNWFKPEDIGFDIYLEDSTDKLSLYAIKEGQATIYKPNTLLITGIGDLGRLGILKKESSSNQQITGVLFNNKVLPEFAYFYLLSMKDQLNDKSSQTTLPILNQKKLSSVKIKIPPMEIQKEFVKFMMHCWSCLKENKIPEVEYSKDKDLVLFAKKSFLTYFGQKEMININNSNEASISYLRQSILQSAVQGKLVKQDPKDEPASELLNKIKAEKEKLIKEGKIRKDKPLAPISEDEISYELPIGWEWVRLGDICNYGSSAKSDGENLKNDMWVLDLEDIESISSRLINKIRFLERKSKSTKNVFYKGDVLFNKLRPYLDKILVADECGVCTTEILPLRVFGDNINPFYFRWMLKSPFFMKYINSVTYGMKMPRLGTEDGQNALIALPPLAEQKRIVEKVDKLMAYCDELEKQVNENQGNAEKLMSAVLKEGFEDDSDK